MSNKQQTAVEWLFEEMQKTYIFNQDDFDMFKQAKEMEKQQIMDAYNISWKLRDKPYATADKYYNETYEQ